MTDTKVLKITDDVSWIGVLDPDIRTFDIVMETKYGTTYNSYFIDAEKGRDRYRKGKPQVSFSHEAQ